MARRGAGINITEQAEFRRTRMQRELVINQLRENGFRITRQRRMLLDIILEGDCSSCKEIYYRALRLDPNIGKATVYRMVNTLESLGAITRRNMYQVNCEGKQGTEACCIRLSDDTVCRLNPESWQRVVREGLRACGYLERQEGRQIMGNDKEESAKNSAM